MRAANVETALRDVIPDVAVRGDSDAFFAELPQALLTALERVGAANDDAPLAPATAEIVAEEGPTFDFGIADYSAEGDLFDSPGNELLADERHDAAEVNPDAPQKPQNLLDRLFATAILPRYAFPTDVVTFTVFDPSSTPYRAEIAYSPQAGLTQALSQYAPGREVWVDGRKFRSMAIYSPFQKDRINAYRAHRLYYECGRCGYAKLEDHDDKHHRGQTEDCPACKKKAGMGPAERWVVPVGFAHPYDEPVELPGEELPLPTRPTRAKLSAPQFDTDHELGRLERADGSGFVTWSSKQSLIVTNLGVRKEGQAETGFYYCPACGRTEPTGWPDGQLAVGRPHRRPYPNHGKQPEHCSGVRRPIVLGHEFLTDIALFSFRLSPELQVPTGSTAGRIVLTTISEALGLAAAGMLDVDVADIGGGHRAAITERGARGNEVEVFLYDTSPGGAGFVRSAARDPEKLLRRALTILENCDCSASCYSCLRSHKNRWDHADLDRHLGASFLRHILFGERPWIPTEVEDRLLAMLRTDLADAGQNVELSDDGVLRLPDFGNRSLVISHPLIRNQPGSVRAHGRAKSRTDRYLDQLLVDRALPAAVLQALDVGSGASDDQPPFAYAPVGVPVYRGLGEFAGAGSDLPVSTLFAELPDAPPDSFVVQLDVDTMENTKLGDTRPFHRGSWHLFVRSDGPDRAPMLLRRIDGKAFQASGMEVTFALVDQSANNAGADRLRVRYASLRPTCRAEQVNAEVVQVFGRFAKVLGA